MTRPYDCPLVFPRIFGSRQCEKIIELGMGLERETGLVSSGSGDQKNEQARLADIAWLSPDGNDGESAWVFNKLATVVQRANKVFKFELDGFTEDAQFTCYDRAGSFYDWHQDGLEGELSTRKLSLVVQLSDPDDYKGCDLEFFSLSCDPEIAKLWQGDLRLQGSVIAFPAFEFHRVTPTRSGKRYSLVCWVGGPPFR